MAMSQDENDLISRLNAVSVCSSEEKLTKQLDKAYISVPPVHTTPLQPFASPTVPFTATDILPQVEEEDPWGDPPKYTSILQGTYFGFSSLPSTDYIPLTPQEFDRNQPFARFRDKPVSFLSAIEQNGQSIGTTQQYQRAPELKKCPPCFGPSTMAKARVLKDGKWKCITKHDTLQCTNSARIAFKSGYRTRSRDAQAAFCIGLAGASRLLTESTFPPLNPSQYNTRFLKQTPSATNAGYIRFILEKVIAVRLRASKI
ncbi:hypothetical protein DFQ30_004362 [Apophysomyces sp. BC1015]|nr:hypothetical protein DFQ30_004362 [Apophysomyces sp. BC1015]